MGTVAIVGVSAAAYAYWTTTGSGTGTASTGQGESIVVNQTSTITGLVPDGPEQDLSGNFDNPNAGPVTIDAVSAEVVDVTEAVGVTGTCSPADFVIRGSSTVSASIPAGDGTGSWSGLTIQLVDSGANQNACKNATVQIAYTAA